MQIGSWKSALLLVTLALGLAGCEEDPVTPPTTDTDALSARVDGTAISFGITPSFSTYDVAAQRGEFGGTLTGTPTRTLQISFLLDLDATTYPSSMEDPRAGITYTTISSGDTAFYNCGILTGNCKLTITRRNGDRVDGTFAATLINSKDSTKKVTITDGQFSAALKRM